MQRNVQDVKYLFSYHLTLSEILTNGWCEGKWKTG